MAKIPDANTEAFYKGLNDRIYYPVVYTKENTLDREAQVNGYSTGVIFESEFMPDNNFTVSFYNEEKGSIESVPLDDNKTFLLAVHKNGEVRLSVLSIKIFRLFVWIRHNDNGNDGMMGVMEFCIVRNNVYQLYVTGVRGLGDPLPYTPGKDTPDKPDETDDVTIDVTIYVKDWVKRTNKDIII